LKIQHLVAGRAGCYVPACRSSRCPCVLHADCACTRIVPMISFERLSDDLAHSAAAELTLPGIASMIDGSIGSGRQPDANYRARPWVYYSGRLSRDDSRRVRSTPSMAAAPASLTHEAQRCSTLREFRTGRCRYSQRIHGLPAGTILDQNRRWHTRQRTPRQTQGSAPIYPHALPTT
jgi:hypothetical protein